jgi:hypothetical protein
MKVYILKMSEKSMLKKTFGPNTNVATGGWRKLYSKELHYLCPSPKVISVITSRMK